jgi:hypothetical protein
LRPISVENPDEGSIRAIADCYPDQSHGGLIDPNATREIFVFRHEDEVITQREFPNLVVA